MAGIEASAASKALTAYRGMFADLAREIAEQPVGDAMLQDLRHETTLGVAGLALVGGLIAELPLAQPRERRNFPDIFTIPRTPEETANLARLRGSLVWCTHPHGGRSEPDPETPYYIVGHRPVESARKREPQPAELLLASAVSPRTEESFPHLLVVRTWLGEVHAAESVMSRLLARKIADDVAHVFNPATGDLEIKGSRHGVALEATTSTGFGVGRHPSRRHVAEAGERMLGNLQSGGTAHIETRAIPGMKPYGGGVLTDSPFPSAYGDRLPRADLHSFQVFSHLNHLATVFGKEAVLDGLLQALPGTDEPSALESLVIERP